MTTTNYGSGVALPIDVVSGAPQYAAKDTRDAWSMLMLGTSGRPLGGRSGLRAGAEPTLSIDASGAWTVTPFPAYVDAGTSSTIGPYFVAFQSAVTGTANPADATFQRIDRIDIQVPDDPPGTAPKSAVLVYKSGTPSGSPAAPSASSRSTPLCQITVPAVGGPAPSIVGTWQYTTALGGIMPATSSSDRPSGKYRGLYVDDPTSGLLRWDGTQWTSSIHGDTGWQSSGIISSASGGTITSQSARLKGGDVQIYVAGTMPAASGGGGTDGDYGNLQVGTLGASWRPARGTGVGSANTGPNYTFWIDSTGAVSVVSGPPAGFAKGAAYSFAGRYYID